MTFNFAELSQEILQLSTSAPDGDTFEEKLSALNNTRSELDYYHREALLSLEKKFHQLCSPLCDQRSSILTTANVQGFWLKAMRNHPLLSNLITESDEEALQYLMDIKLSYFEDVVGFKLDFIFKPNPYFDNEIISKSYYLENVKEAYFQNLLFDRTETSKIAWKDGKNLCVKEVTKTQRHKSSGSMRTVTKTVDVESFFHFFDSMKSPDENNNYDEEQIAAIEEEIHIDLELGNVFKTIVQRGYDWFTGKALSYENFESEIEDISEGDFMDDESGVDESAAATSEEENDKTYRDMKEQQCKQQ